MESNNNFSSYLKLINNCDPDDPLLSATELGKRLAQIPLAHVNSSDLSPLNHALNLEQLVRTADGLARDYRGLAELMGFVSAEVETRFKRLYNPTKSLIDAYVNKNLSEDQQNGLFTVNDLLKMIERLERFDIIDDFLPTLVRLASDAQLGQNRMMAIRAVSLLDGGNDSTVAVNAIALNGNNLVKDLDRLTVDDTARLRTLYDAFVCYAPEDGHHAEELMTLLREHDKKIATADDLLPGHFEHDAIVQLIDMRCRKVIIILTPNFLRSKECEFQSKFASEIAIQAGRPKIIPVLYEACDDGSLPYMIRVISKIDMTNRQARSWQLKKLLSSLEFHHRAHNSIYTRHTRQLSTLSNLNQTITNSATITQSGSQSQIPAMFSTSQQVSGNQNEPIVDLLHSQNSSAISSNCNLNILLDTMNDCSTKQSQNPQTPPKLSPTPSTISSSSPLNWFKNVKRKVLGNSASIDSASQITSSQAMLITSSSAECLSNSSRDNINGTGR